MGIATSVAAAWAAGAQTLPGLDPVKVKTIPMGANAAALGPPYPLTSTNARPFSLQTQGLNVPTTRAKTVRVGRKGRPSDLAVAGPAPVQTFPGLDPVKVKTIPMGANAAAPVPPYPRTPTTARPLKPLTPGPDWPTTRVKTLRIDRDGHVVDRADVEGSHPEAR